MDAWEDALAAFRIAVRQMRTSALVYLLCTREGLEEVARPGYDVHDVSTWVVDVRGRVELLVEAVANEIDGRVP